MTEPEIVSLLTILEKIGVLSLLGVALVMFYRGDILSRKTVENMIHVIVEQTVSQTVEKITEKIGATIGDKVAERLEKTLNDKKPKYKDSW